MTDETKPYVRWLERTEVGKMRQMIMELTELVRKQEKEIKKLKQKEKEK